MTIEQQIQALKNDGYTLLAQRTQRRYGHTGIYLKMRHPLQGSKELIYFFGDDPDHDEQIWPSGDWGERVKQVMEAAR